MQYSMLCRSIWSWHFKGPDRRWGSSRNCLQILLRISQKVECLEVDMWSAGGYVFTNVSRETNPAVAKQALCKIKIIYQDAHTMKVCYVNPVSYILKSSIFGWVSTILTAIYPIVKIYEFNPTGWWCVHSPIQQQKDLHISYVSCWVSRQFFSCWLRVNRLNYWCKDCGAAFTQKGNLKAHEIFIISIWIHN